MNTTMTPMQRLRDANPVPSDALSGTAQDSLGQATLDKILAATPGPAAPTGPLARWRRAWPGPRRVLARPQPGSLGRRPRFRWRIAVPAAAVVSACAVAVAVAFSGTGAPPRSLVAAGYRLDAFLTIHPPATPGDAVAVLRQLAARAAAQPAPALGPVEYSSRLEWQDIGDNIPRYLNFREHTYWQVELWYGPHGENAGRTTRFTRQQPGGQVLGASVAPARFWAPDEWAAVNPATLPPSPAELRVLLLRLGQPRGYLSRPLVTYSEGLMLMENEPLPPAVRAGILRVIASIAAHPYRGTRFVVLGTATDLAGRTGIALGVEQANNPGPGFQYLTTWIFDPRTGALLDTADAGCKIKLGTIPEVQGDCVPYDYTQYTKATAVPAFPGFPVTPKDWGDVVW